MISKVCAVYLGPSGYALYGNFKNILQGVFGITASGFESGTIRYIAENKSDNDTLSKVTSSVVLFSLILSVIVGVLLILFSVSLSNFVFKSLEYKSFFIYLALLLPLSSLNFILVYIFNGFQKIKIYARLVSLFNVFNAVLTFSLVYYFNLKGALYASILVYALTLVLSFLFKDVRTLLSSIGLMIKQVSVTYIKSMSVYIAMAIYSSLLFSICYLLIRNEIIANYGINQAGYWEAMNKISSFYMVFFTSIFTMYLLPKLSVNNTLTGYKQIMKAYFTYLLPLAASILLILFLLRGFVVKLFFTSEFEIVGNYFHLQFVGDFLKIVAFSFAYQFHAKKMFLFYFITDALLYGSFYFLSIFFLDTLSIKGVFLAYIISTIIYLAFVMLFIFTNNRNYLIRYEN